MKQHPAANVSPRLLYDYVETPIDEIARIHDRVTKTFASGKTLPLEYRRVQLRKLFHGLRDNGPAIVAALKADLYKPDLEGYVGEQAFCETDVDYALKNLDKWTRDVPPEVPLMQKLVAPRIKKEPIGAVFLIGPFNYPIQLLFSPLVGVIAAGCTAVLKPSEMTPHCAAVITKIVQEYLDPDAYAVVNGGVPETTESLVHRWDKIMYTGNGMVARIVGVAAAKHLTPVLMELGGLNPTFITSNADAELAGPRIAWGKVNNAGQVCISPDYALVDPSVEATWVESYRDTLKRWFPNGTQAKNAMGRVINERHFNRIKGLLDSTKGEIMVGGRTDASEYFIEPTVVRVNSFDDPLLSEEIFGPVFPYMVIEGGVPEMIPTYKRISPNPLALYLFTNDKIEQEYILDHTRSGGVAINDVMFQGAVQTLPFGGIGESGSGCYRGRYSYEAFTYYRAIVNPPRWIESTLGKVRYPPYDGGNEKYFRKNLAVGKVNFDRNGKLLYGSTFWKIVLLGAGDPTGGIVRYLIALLSAFFLRNFFSLARK